MARTESPAGRRTCGARHWFTYYQWVGSSSPVCRRCGAPNPNYRPDDDPKASNPFKPGDWALHKNNQLDSREVAEISGGMIRLKIGSVPDAWVPAANYTKVG